MSDTFSHIRLSYRLNKAERAILRTYRTKAILNKLN